MNKIKSNTIIALSIIWIVLETIYFNFNMFPSSIAETICDIIGVTGILIGYNKKDT